MPHAGRWVGTVPWMRYCTYVHIFKAIIVQETVTLTELRQRLFQFADQVIESGEPLVIERRGVRLRLVREDVAVPKGGRLSRLVPRKQSVVIGPPLDPHESPAEWSGDLYPEGFYSKVVEPPPESRPQSRQKSSRRRKRT